MTRLLTYSVLLITLLVASCGEQNPPEPISSSSTPAINQAPSKISYNATLAEGINFKRDGYPSFVADVHGLADEKEFFGRWSVADEVTINFVEPLPAKFTVELVASAFGPNVNKPMKIIVGEKEQQFVLASGYVEKMQKVLIHVSIAGKVTSIKFRIPFARTPKSMASSTDERRLGIAFGDIKIYE